MRLMKRHCLALLLVPLGLGAQEQRCLVEGMVANSVTSEPVRRALITLGRASGSGSYTVATDPLGKFVIANLEPGTYVVSAERSGFAPVRRAATITLGPGERSSGVMVLMTPHAVITGRVTDEDGEPAIGADVQVSTLGYSQGRKMLSRVGGGSTNDLGEYRVFGLAPGRYYVSASIRSNPLPNSQEEYVTTYYPKTTDAGAAIPLEVAAGAQLRNIDVTLTKARTVFVRGKVSCDVEAQKRILMVTLAPQIVMGIASTGIGSRGGAVRPDGSFEIRNVPTGSYMLTGMANLDNKTLSTRMPLQVGGTNIENLQLSIRAGMTVKGRVRVEGRQPEDLPSFNVGLQPSYTGGILYGNVPRVRTQPDGTFQLDDVGADHYDLYVTGMPDGHYLKSAYSGSIDVRANGIEAAAGMAPLEIVISPNAGGLDGTVMDPGTQKPAMSAAVVLIPRDRDRSELYRNVQSDQAGRFHFKNLVPGEYRIYAWEEVPQYAWMDPDFMRPLESKGEAITIPEGSPQSVQLTMIGRK